VYVNAPELFDVGAVILKDTSVPSVFVGMAVSAPIVGVAPNDGEPSTQFDNDPDSVKLERVPFLADGDASIALLPEVDSSL
jgi:hypothetical protein